MKDKDRVTLVLAVSATETHKIPVTVIGKAVVPVCFKTPSSPLLSPLLLPKVGLDGRGSVQKVV